MAVKGMGISDGVKFENDLREELPRGYHGKETTAGGGERGVEAAWLTADEMRPTDANKQVWKTEGGVLLGMRGGRVVGWYDDRHMMTIAGSRAGKGVSLIVPNLLTYQGSAIVIDPKGENARLTADRRVKPKEQGGLGQKVYVLDPFDTSGRKEKHGYNPLADLDLTAVNVADDAGALAGSLIEVPQVGDKYWAESAQTVLKGLILLVLGFASEEQRTLLAVRQLLALTHDRIAALKAPLQTERGEELSDEEVLIELLISGPRSGNRPNPYKEFCEAVGKQLRGMGEKERGGVLSTAITQTAWLDSPAMAKVVGHSNFKMSSIKTDKTTVYLCLPAMRLPTHARWLRMMVLMTIGVMEQTRVDGKMDVKPPVLFVLDEFAVLGHIDAIEKAAGLMAGFGVKLWVIVQNLGQLKQHYDKAWEVFFANSGVVTAFGISDSETLETLSKMVGRRSITVMVPSGATTEDIKRGGSATKEERRQEPLLSEDELRSVFSRKKNRVLILNVEDLPAIAERFTYWEPGSMFDGMFPKEA